MFVRVKIPRFHANPPGHAEMNAEPIVTREFEEHPFAARRRAEKFSIDQSSTKFAAVCFPKNPISPVQPNTDNLFAQAGVPLLAIPFDLSQLGHRADYASHDGGERWIDRSAGRC